MEQRKLIFRGMNWFGPILALISVVWIGFFLGMRLQAFLLDARGIVVGQAFVWGIAAVLCAAVMLLKAWTRLPDWVSLRTVCVSFAAAMLFCILTRRILIDRVLAGASLSGAVYPLLIVGEGLLLTLFFLVVFAVLRSVWGSICRGVRRLRARDFVFAACLLAILNLCAVAYMRASFTIYSWDNAGYWTRAQALSEISGLRTVLRTVYTSILTDDYNYLIVLPFAPIVRIFGPSRLVFILCIANLYLFPLLLLVYGIAKRRSAYPIFTASCAMLSVPMLLQTTLVGFVDVGGVFFTLFAAALCPSGTGDKHRAFVCSVLSGFFLAAAVLMRRWYSFFALSFVISELVSGVLFRRRISDFLWTVGAFGFILLFFFQPMVSGLLLKDYAGAYSAYSMPVRNDFMLFFRYFGVFSILLALGSFCRFGWKKGSRPGAVFLFCQAVLCFLIFISVQTHGQQHLLLYVPMIIIALTALYGLVPVGNRKWLTGVVMVAALLPALSPFLPRKQPHAISEIHSAAILPSFTYTPSKRDDAMEIVRMVRYLDDTVGTQGKTVGVLASSFLLNDDILRNAEASLNLPRVSDVPRSYILALPAVDSRDWFPGALFDCDYLLVADPVQLHLGAEKQRVVAIPAQEVLEGTGFGAAYMPMDETFSIGDGSIKVRLYQKSRALTEEEKLTLISEVQSAIEP